MAENAQNDDFQKEQVKYEFSWQQPLWESHEIHQTLSGLQICEYWEGLRISLIHSVLQNFNTQKEQNLALWASPFEQLRLAITLICAEICIESWWVGSHIKLSYDLEQNVTEVRTQFDMAVNPLWFNINLRTMAPAWCDGWCFLAPECHFQKGLFFMNYFYKTCSHRSRENTEDGKKWEEISDNRTVRNFINEYKKQVKLHIL